MYDDEFDYAAEDDPTISAVIEYISISDNKTITSSIFNTELLQHPIPFIL